MLLNLTENDFFFLREAFYDLEYCRECVCDRGFARIPLGELTTLFQTL